MFLLDNRPVFLTGKPVVLFFAGKWFHTLQTNGFQPSGWVASYPAVG